MRRKGLSFLLVSAISVLSFGASAAILTAEEPSPVSRARIALPFPPDTGEESIGNLELLSLESICGPQNDSQHVELYDGSLGPPQAFVMAEQGSTAQIQWLSDLPSRFPRPNDDPGNVNGQRWCTATLIADDLLVTAAHCFRVKRPGDPSGWLTPRRGGIQVEASGLAQLMQVNFNFQVNGESHNRDLREEDSYPIVELVEYGDELELVDNRRLDFAIVRVGPGVDGDLPVVKYPVADLDVSDEARDQAADLTMIQHPAGQPKMIEAGANMVEPRDIFLRYGDLDTLGGSSGSGIIDQNGRLIGVHTNGGCTAFSGFNFGVSLTAIRQVSAVIVPEGAK